MEMLTIRSAPPWMAASSVGPSGNQMSSHTFTPIRAPGDCTTRTRRPGVK